MPTFLRIPFLASSGFILVLSSIFLMINALGDLAFSQPAGLYKNGEKLLEFEQVDDSTFLAKDLPADIKELVASSPFAKAMPTRPMVESARSEDYFQLLGDCSDLVSRLSDSKARDWTSEEDALDLEVLALRIRSAREGYLQRLLETRSDLESGRLPGTKLGRHLDFLKSFAEESENLLGYLDEYRAAREALDPVWEEEAVRNLSTHFTTNPIQLQPSPIVDAPLPIATVKREEAPVSFSDPPESILYPNARLLARGYDPADLQETIDVQITPQIAALAESLGRSPVKIYNYVRDHCAFEAYLGSRKGSQQTLNHKSGNDTDQASLLIALLRAAQIPARYAEGVVEIPLARVANWLGFIDEITAANYLATAGFEPTLYYSGGAYVLSFRRVWVEGWIPFTNYRGAVNDTTGQRWVPLDPAYKQYVRDHGIDLPAELGFDAEQFVEDYYGTVRPLTPIEVFREMLIAELPSYYPGATYDDLLPTNTLLSETDGILAGTLPYKLISYDGHYSAIASEDRYKIRFHIYGSGSSLDYTANLPEISEKQVTISYIGATPGDQQTIDDAGGIYSVEDPWLVDLKPVLKIDGCTVATGSGAVMMGLTQTSDMHFTTPAGDHNEIPVIYNTITAGNYQGIGIDTERVQPSYLSEPETTCEEYRSGWEAHQLALTYLDKVDRAGDEAADLMHLIVMNDVSEAIVENSVTVWLSGGLPSELDWTGMIVDADRKIIGPFSVDGTDDSCDYMRLAGADGSIQENRLFEDRFEEEAVSTIKILGLANDMGIPVCKIVNSITTDCPGFSHPQYVRNAVNSALSHGHHVIIPRDPISYYEWDGTGYIALEPTTCAAGYIIAGGHNGGATVQEWGIPWFILWLLGIKCEKAYDPITVSPTSPNDYYCANSWDFWTFHVPQIDFYGHDQDGNCVVKQSLPMSFHVWLPIRIIAWIWGPGEYIFTAGGPGPCPQCEEATLTVTIVEIDVSLPSKVRLGEDVTITYKILPDGCAFDEAEIQVKNASDNLVYQETGIEPAGGQHTTEWEKAKWNQGSSPFPYANPNNGPYRVTILGRKGGFECQGTGSINTEFVIEADVEDPKPASGKDRAGMADVEDALEIVVSCGGVQTIFDGSHLDVTHSDDYTAHVTVENSDLNQLPNGECEIVFRDLRDEIGNFGDTDLGVPGIQPITYRLKLE